MSAEDKSLDSDTSAFLIIQQGSRATEVDELLFPGCFQIVFHIYGKIQNMHFLHRAVSLLNVTTFEAFSPLFI